MGDDVPITTNEQGGRQSHLPYRYDLIDPLAWAQLASVLHHGAQKHAPENWRKISIADHLNHLIAHVVAYQAGDEQDDHLGHAFARSMMALALHLEFRAKMKATMTDPMTLNELKEDLRDRFQKAQERYTKPCIEEVDYAPLVPGRDYPN